MTNNKSKPLMIISIIVILALAIGSYFVFKPKSKLILSGPAVVINTQGQPTLGNPQAKIHIVVFEDLKCVNCKFFNMQIFPKIKEKYIDTGIAQYSLINLAFIPGSGPAANSAHCLYAQNKNYFFPFVDYIFSHQPSEEEDWATLATLLQFAKKATPQANFEELSHCIIENRYNNLIDSNLKVASTIMHDQVATPTIYINGYKVDASNGINFEGIADLIEALRKSQ